MADRGEGKEEDDVSIPRAALNKMIKELLPNIRVATDARELILQCCNEFIHLVSKEGNKICTERNKKTIGPDHILAALENLGFGCYLKEAEATLQSAKEVAQKKRRGSKINNSGISEEELHRQQQALFAKAREEQAAKTREEWESIQRVLQTQLRPEKQYSNDSDYDDV